MAIEESVRRIRAIALVHETLSREAGDDVAFVEIVRPLVRMVEEGMSSEDRPVRFTVEGDAGFLPATVATPLAVVLNELLQNAIDHAFPVEPRPAGRAGPGRGARSRNDGERLQATVVDDGVGLPEGFSLDAVDRARAVDRAHARDVRAGRHDLARAGHRRTATGPGTVVRLDVPVDRARASDARSRTQTRTDLLRGAGGRMDRKAERAQAVRRWRATYCLRSWRRSSSEVPPQTPESWLVARAYSRHGAWASH